MDKSSGQLVTIIGPSGVGKDSIMLALKEQCPDVHLVKRVITRPEEAGGEDFTGVSVAEFEARKAAGDFVLHWSAHGLEYGIPKQIDDLVAMGKVVIFNGSRAALPSFEARYPEIKTILIMASHETLSKRLSNRGRETASEVENRLKRASYKMPKAKNMSVISNDGELQQAVDQLKTLIIPKTESAL
ncbi:MAG: phosphonate metabolism protein/1,5-bisphosphokinase (PRPP-forming) PhnN [Rhizobiaceae bacterium]|nr:phosphonate metabolism protein/1,5-bisphosphokinase (PRPP-forming) PhnN [Rhizobiaceae bacterium]